MKIDPLLAEKVQVARGGDEISVIITFERHEDVGILIEKGIKPSVVYESIPSAAARLSPRQISELAAMPQVKLIELDTEAKALDKP